MKGAKIIYSGLGDFLREKRKAAGYDLEQAAMMIGLTSASYLASCEVGRCNFPFSKLTRTMELYGVKPGAIVDVAAADYKKSLLEALK